MKSIIHVNRQNIDKNTKLGEQKFPTYIVRQGTKSWYGFAIEIKGPATLIDPRKHKPLKCAEVKIIGKTTFKEAMSA